MITFKPIEKEDLPLLKQWRNSDCVRNYVREYRLLTDSDQETWYSSYISSRRKSDFDQEIMIMSLEIETGFSTTPLELEIHKIISNRQIGVGGFTSIQWRNQKAELTFYVAPEGRYSVDGSIEKSLMYLSLKELLKKGFYEFNFHKIYWPVFGHDVNLATYQSIFKTEAVLKEEYFWNGKYYDRLYLSLLRSEFDKL